VSGVAGSSPACSEVCEGGASGTGIGCAGGRLGAAEFVLTGDDEVDEDEDDGRGGDCDREAGRVWMAASTFL
jgi:hypothetical protein